MIRSLTKGLLLSGVLLLGACGGADEAAEAEDELQAKPDEHWFYNGSLPKLDNAAITVSLAGHTAHVTGTVAAGVDLPDLPHIRVKAENGQQRVDVVYPIATARPGKSNSRPGSYAVYQMRPYRPDGAAFTQAEGWHDVPWGGFPFIAYNQGVAFHGPITSADNKSVDDMNVWYLQRGPVSGGCNRMLGEHVVELAHLIGVPMTKVYVANKIYTPRQAPVNVTAAVKVIADYDTYEGKYIDVDYPTHGAAVRPGKVHGVGRTEMFGSWIASETPDGKDNPKDMAWEGGVSGKKYVFSEHMLPNTVCSMPKSTLPALRSFIGSGEVPKNLCAKKACYVDALKKPNGATLAQSCAN